MPLEVECHTIPHLEAHTHGIDHTSGHDSTFTIQNNSLKTTPPHPRKSFEMYALQAHL